MPKIPALIAILVLAVACGPRQPAPSKNTPSVELRPITFNEWQQELQARRGQLLVVDMWATWCIPCLERFPRMVELHHEYGPQGVSFISMCLDDRDDAEAVEAARRFLVKQEATFTNYLMDENITDAFEKLDLLGIPAVFIYDRQGELRYRLTGDDPNSQFTDEDVEKAITELLSASA